MITLEKTICQGLICICQKFKPFSRDLARNLPLTYVYLCLTVSYKLSDYLPGLIKISLGLRIFPLKIK